MEVTKTKWFHIMLSSHCQSYKLRVFIDRQRDDYMTHFGARFSSLFPLYKGVTRGKFGLSRRVHAREAENSWFSVDSSFPRQRVDGSTVHFRI